MGIYQIRVETSRLITDVAVNPKANLIYVADHPAGTISAIDGKTNFITKTISVGEYPGREEELHD